MEGHTNNISFTVFHPNLLILEKNLPSAWIPPMSYLETSKKFLMHANLSDSTKIPLSVKEIGLMKGAGSWSM